MANTRLADVNFTHLRSYRAAISCGSIAAAARQLGLAQPTLSEHISSLERALGHSLSERRAGIMIPTVVGQRVLEEAEVIFSAAQRLNDTLDHDHQAPVSLVIGIVETVPKRIAWKLIEPATMLPERVILHCKEGSFDALLAELSIHRLDVVIADAPLPPAIAIQSYNHLLGDSGASWFAVPGLIPPGPWPRRLHEAPILLPSASPLRRRLDDWCENAGIRPRLVAEFQDSALLKAAGAARAGAFPAVTVLADQLAQEIGAELLGHCTGINERFYAISPERRITNPAVEAICRSARQVLTANRRR